MNLYLQFFISAAVMSMLFTQLVKRFAKKYNIVDKPEDRKIHTKPIPRLGGVGVIIAFILAVSYALIFQPSLLQFSNQNIFGIDVNLAGVLIGIIILAVIGILDDISGVSPSIKLTAHFLAGIVVVIFGIKIWWIHNPLGGLDIVLGNWTYVLVPLWIVLIINVVNWLDGLDGLATGIGLIASIILYFLSITDYVNQPATALLAIILAGALAGFLPYNFNPASIFLGDVGSMFIGFMIGIFAIISGAKLATAALIMGLPILDAIFVITRRIMKGVPIWQADRLHLHHRLFDSGFSQRQVVLFMYLVSTIFGFVALKNSNTETKIQAMVYILVLGAAIAFYLLLSYKRRIHGKSKI